jgi:hypothetical protein
MGWWSKEKNGKELDIGDVPLDAINSALKKVAKSYKGSLKRKPTPEELTELLESSIRVLEEDLFDDMEERELDSVTIKIRQRPKRPRPKAGDYFAIPLPSGGYGYGRVMKITLRRILWMRLLDVQSKKLVSLDDVQGKKVLIDLDTRTQKIDSVEWPIIGHVPLSDEEQIALVNEPLWITGYTAQDIEEIAEWKLNKKRGLPPNLAWSTPYEGYRDI